MAHQKLRERQVISRTAGHDVPEPGLVERETRLGIHQMNAGEIIDDEQLSVMLVQLHEDDRVARAEREKNRRALQAHGSDLRMG